MKKLLLSVSLILVGISAIAQYTAIPDPDFENALAAYDDIPNDGQIPTANIEIVTFLNVTNQNISDLTGIEDFTNLERLFCGDNQLTSLDISQNIPLYDLFCFDNDLTSLNISNNPALLTINCSGNQLSNIDLSQNILIESIELASNTLTSLDVSMLQNLEFLGCSNNPINTLDVSQNLLLTDLWCGVNGLTTLDVSNNNSLEVLVCPANQLTEFDLSANPFLTKIMLWSNQLTSLDVRNGNNTNIITEDFKVQGNPGLTCISVDDVPYATANWTNIDPQTSFNVDCALGLNDNELSEFLLYPNPTKNSFSIYTNNAINKVVIFDNLGREVANYKEQYLYKVSNLSSGLYYIKIVSESHTIAKKLIIK